MYQVWDIYSQNWNTGSHLKLWQESVKIQHRCEQISNIPSHGWRSCKNWFFMLTTFLALGIFSIHDIWKEIKKWPGPIIFFVSKNQLCRVRQPCKRIFEICFVFSHFFVRASNGCQYSNFGNKCPKLGTRTPEGDSVDSYPSRFVLLYISDFLELVSVNIKATLVSVDVRNRWSQSILMHHWSQYAPP